MIVGIITLITMLFFGGIQEYFLLDKLEKGTKIYIEDKDKFAEEAEIPRRTLFRMLSPKGNPTLENISKVIHKLCT